MKKDTKSKGQTTNFRFWNQKISQLNLESLYKYKWLYEQGTFQNLKLVLWPLETLVSFFKNKHVKSMSKWTKNWEKSCTIEIDISKYLYLCSFFTFTFFSDFCAHLPSSTYIIIVFCNMSYLSIYLYHLHLTLSSIIKRKRFFLPFTHFYTFMHYCK